MQLLKQGIREAVLSHTNLHCDITESADFQNWCILADTFSKSHTCKKKRSMSAISDVQYSSLQELKTKCDINQPLTLIWLLFGKTKQTKLNSGTTERPRGAKERRVMKTGSRKKEWNSGNFFFSSKAEQHQNTSRTRWNTDTQ